MTTSAHSKPRETISQSLTREQRWEGRFEIPTIVAALLVIPTLIIDESGLPGGWQVLAGAMTGQYGVSSALR